MTIKARRSSFLRRADLASKPPGGKTGDIKPAPRRKDEWQTALFDQHWYIRPRRPNR